MRIETSAPVLNNNDAIIEQITEFWNGISNAWREIWGPHIHHGFYDTQETVSPLYAQEKLIKKLSNLIDPHPGDKILDVGCGMGGSSIYLAREYQTEVTGITLSPKQLEIAQKESQLEPNLKLKFQIEDAHHLISFSDNEFDIIWSLESCEQFYNKPLFLEQASRVLKPGGKLLLATWCSDQDYYENQDAINYKKICKAFDLPYMPTIGYYSDLLQQNYKILSVFDWSCYVKQSWELGMKELKKYSYTTLFNLGGLTGMQFVRNLKLISEAFNTGKMRYGVFVAVKK